MDMALLQDTIAGIAQSIHRMMDVDVIIADDGLNTVVNTLPTYTGRVPITPNSVLGTAIRTGQPMKVKNRKSYYGCKPCPAFNTCTIGGMVCVPIRRAGTTAGGIMLSIPVARVPEIFDDIENVENYLTIMADLIASKMQTIVDSEQLAQIQVEKQMLLEARTAAVVGTDRAGFIIHCNQAFRNTFGVSESIEGQFIGNALSAPELIEFLKMEHDIADRPITVDIDGVRSCGFLSCRRVMSNHIHIGNVISFQRLRAIKGPVTRYLRAIWNPADFTTLSEQGYIGDEVVWMCNALPPDCRRVLLEGHTPYSRTQIAGCLHCQLGRNGAPFLKLDCGEDDLFDWLQSVYDVHERRLTPWGEEHFAVLEGGTLYLKDVQAAPLHQQSRLYRLLRDLAQSGAHNILLIAGVDQPVKPLVKRGLFLESLRRELCAEHLDFTAATDLDAALEQCIGESLAFFSRVHGKPIPEFSLAAQQALVRHMHLRGVRAMRQTLEVLVARDETHEVSLDELEAVLPQLRDATFVETLAPRDLELEHIRQMLWNGVPKKEIARRLNISRATLYRRLHDLGEDVQDRRPPQ